MVIKSEIRKVIHEIEKSKIQEFQNYQYLQIIIPKLYV